MGDTRYNDRLPRVGLADQERRTTENRAFLTLHPHNINARQRTLAPTDLS